MKAVIMAGGLGTRLRPLTKVIPKPLLPLGHQSILDTIIGSLGRAGVKEVILATNYRSEMFEEYFAEGEKDGVKVRISKEEKRLNTAGHLSLIKEDLSEPFIVTNGDILTNLDFKDLYNFHMNNNADITIVATTVQTPLAYGVVKEDNGMVADIHEKPNIVSEVLAGIYVLSPGAIADMQHNEPKPMTDLIRDSISKGMRVKKYLLQNYWLDIGMMENYQKAIGDITSGSVVIK